MPLQGTDLRSLSISRSRYNNGCDGGVNQLLDIEVESCLLSKESSKLNW